MDGQLHLSKRKNMSNRKEKPAQKFTFVNWDINQTGVRTEARSHLMRDRMRQKREMQAAWLSKGVTWQKDKAKKDPVSQVPTTETSESNQPVKEAVQDSALTPQTPLHSDPPMDLEFFTLGPDQLDPNDWLLEYVLDDNHLDLV